MTLEELDIKEDNILKSLLQSPNLVYFRQLLEVRKEKYCHLADTYLEDVKKWYYKGKYLEIRDLLGRLPEVTEGDVRKPGQVLLHFGLTTVYLDVDRISKLLPSGSVVVEGEVYNPDETFEELKERCELAQYEVRPDENCAVSKLWEDESGT